MDNFAGMESKRQQKISRQIQKDMGEIFQKDPRHFFGNSLVTLTEVEVSPDLSLAKMYLSVYPAKDAKDVFFRLNEMKSEIRRLLGNKIGKRIRKIPELAFFHDDTEEKASYMDRLIDSLDIPPGEENDDEQK